ncbi:MAG: glycosyltransferase [Candidatus Diapherotrites archaeon]|uniref:Glycosyltransferase n=1 Tax=Candidatus Iainarchaeum sp. TaxID=3101447 RepID=A0A8T3YLN9_9ARCH|nr:glycosyltransferase [Candidatus Diapherotrites archaeon]
MKVVLIGPLPPQRGGIAHSNRMLLKNLSAKHDVLAVSFSRIIPKAIYPGKLQREEAGTHDGATLEIDSMNPVSWLKAKSRIREFGPDTILFQWWTTFLVPCYLFLASGLKTRKAAICQNVFPHSEGPLKWLAEMAHSALAKAFLGKMDKLIAMSGSDKKLLGREFSRKEISLYIEPPYDLDGVDAKAMGREEAKEMLGLSGKNVVLFFGFVREYKGLRYLLEAMPEIAKETGAKLLIVGEFWERKENYENEIQRLGISDSVIIVDRYVPNAEVAKYFLAADLLCLPYTAISESGVIRMAFAFSTPILSTDVGGNPDHISDGLNGFIVPSMDGAQLAQKAVQFFRKKLYRKFSEGMREKRKELDWSDEKEKSVLG